jgi:predicted acyltransferase
MVVAIAVYGIITNNNTVFPYEMFLVGIFMVLAGISDLRKTQKKGYIYYFLIAAISFIEGIYQLVAY